MIDILSNKISSSNINLDENYGPYSSLNEAHLILVDNEANQVGVTVGIKSNTTQTIEEYWYQGGTDQVNLVKKQSSEVEIDENPTQGSTNPVSSGGVYTELSKKGTYSIPSGGIPKTDLTSDVQTSLGKADTALQSTDITNLATKSELSTGLASKQNTISASSKISSDFVDDTTGTNKFVTSTEKGLISTAIQGVKKGTETLTPESGVVTIPSDIESAQATSVPSNQSATATIDSSHVLQLGIPRGADAVNPFKGLYTSDLNLPDNPSVGDYAYVINQSPAGTASVYVCATAGTWTDSTEDVDLNNNSVGQFNAAAKNALLTLLGQVAYADNDGQSYIDNLSMLLFGESTSLLSLTAVFDAQGSSFHESDTIQDLLPFLTVYANYSNGEVVTLPTNAYTVTGVVAEGTSTFTVHFLDKQTTFQVTILPSATLVSISASIQNQGVIFNTDSLDVVKQYLIVIATYSDNTTQQLTDSEYELYGTLVAPSSVITVSYSGQTDTVTVVVTAKAISGMTAVLTDQNAKFYTTDNINIVKDYLDVDLVFNDSSTQQLSANDYTITSPSDLSTAGTTQITIEYNNDSNVTANVTISVIAGFALRQTFVSDGTNQMDTGILPSDSEYTTVMIKWRNTELPSATATVFGNRTGTLDAFGLFVRDNGCVFGMGMGFSGSTANLVNKTMLGVFVMHYISGSTGNCVAYIRQEGQQTNIKDNVSNNYSEDKFTQGNIFLGKDGANSALGFKGSIYDCKIFPGQPTQQDIDNYLSQN